MSTIRKCDLRKLALIAGALILGSVAFYFTSAGRFGSWEGKMGSIPYQDIHDSYKPLFRYETVPGLFTQDDPNTDPATFDHTKHNLGLINRAYDSDASFTDAGTEVTQWQRFERYVLTLNATAPKDTAYKVIYNSRHGQGTHNVAEAYYGTPSWDEYWSKLDGNGTLYWVDAHLTAEGEEQAKEAGLFFGEQIAWAKMPAPQTYVVSPLYRCLQTAQLTFSGLRLPEDRLFKPMVKEMIREVMGEHTCDRRSSRSVIAEAFPRFSIEPKFAEEDILWEFDHRESWAEHDARTQRLLDDVFEHDPSSFISFTSHSGSIASMLRIVGHRDFRVPTGGLIPIFIKASRIG